MIDAHLSMYHQDVIRVASGATLWQSKVKITHTMSMLRNPMMHAYYMQSIKKFCAKCRHGRLCNVTCEIINKTNAEISHQNLSPMILIKVQTHTFNDAI